MELLPKFFFLMLLLLYYCTATQLLSVYCFLLFSFTKFMYYLYCLAAVLIPFVISSSVSFRNIMSYRCWAQKKEEPAPAGRLSLPFFSTLTLSHSHTVEKMEKTVIYCILLYFTVSHVLFLKITLHRHPQEYFPGLSGEANIHYPTRISFALQLPSR